MAISTNKTEIYAEGTTDISWTRFQTNLGAQEPTNIRFGVYKRDTSDAEQPLVPDAIENENIGTEESGNLRVGAFRGAIKDHTVTFDNASEYENVQFDKYFGSNLVKNVPKNLNVDGIIYSNKINKPAARIDVEESVRNFTIDVGTSGAIYGAGGPSYQGLDNFDGSIGVVDAAISENPACDGAILYGWYTRTTNASTNGTSNINQLVIIWNGEVVYNEPGSNVSLTTDDGTAYSNWADGVDASGWSASDLSTYMFDGNLNTFAKAETSNTDFLGWSNSGTNLPALQGPVEIYIKYADFANYSYEVNGSGVTPTLYSSPAGEADWLTISEGTVNSFRVTAPASNINIQIAAIRSNGVILTPTALYGGSGVSGVTINGYIYSPLSHFNSTNGWHKDGTTCGTADGSNSEFVNGFNVGRKRLSNVDTSAYSTWADGVQASGWFASDLSTYMFDGNLNRFSKAETSNIDYLGWDNSGTGLATLQGPVEIYIAYANVGNYTYQVNGASVTPDTTGAPDAGAWITLSTGSVNSFRVTAPASNINVQIAAVRSNGVILLHANPPSTQIEGISGGTALYVDSDSNSRNFKISLESSGGSFGKLYGGGGGGITGNSGTSASRSSCVRNQDNSYNYVQPRTCTGSYTNPPQYGNTNTPATVRRYQHTLGPGGRNANEGEREQSRWWDQRAENHCRTVYGGNHYGGHPGPGANGHNDWDPYVRAGHPWWVEGAWIHYCNFPGFSNPTYPGNTVYYNYSCPANIYVPGSRSFSGSITSPGGLGGIGGKGQGYQRSFESGTAGGTPSPVSCSSLGSLWSGPSVTGSTGSPGTSGGNWGEPGTSSDVATGGLAGYSYKKSESQIDIEVIGGDDSRLKGRNN